MASWPDGQVVVLALHWAAIELKESMAAPPLISSCTCHSTPSRMAEAPDTIWPVAAVWTELVGRPTSLRIRRGSAGRG